jgi:hypothetical protein
MTHRFVAILLTSFTCAVAGQASPSNRGAVPGACALLSQREVEEAAGMPVREGVPLLRSGVPSSRAFIAERLVRLTVLLRPVPTAEWASEQVVRMTRGVHLGTYREVPGIGDRSFLYEMRQSGAVLCVFESGYYLQFSLASPGLESRAPAVLERLARSALALLAPATSRWSRSGAIPYKHGLTNPLLRDKLA